MYGGGGVGINFGTNPYYQPYIPTQQPQMQQQTQQTQPQVQTQPQQTTNTNKIYVNGIEDVRNRPLLPNSDMIFIDNDKPLIYQKTVDSKGQFEVKTFELSDYKPADEPKTTEPTNLSNYVQISDLEPLQSEIKALNEKVSKLDVKYRLNEIDKGKETKQDKE